MAAKKRTTEFKKLADFPEHKEATARLAELATEQGELNRTINRLQAEIGDDNTSDAKTEASALVSGSTAVGIAKPDTRIELQESKKRLEVINEAVAMQRAAVNEITITCQKAMGEERRPVHIEIAKRIDKAMADLEAAVVDERQHREAAVDDGCNRMSVPVISLPGNFGRQRGNSWGTIRAWRLKMAQIGYIKFDGRDN